MRPPLNNIKTSNSNNNNNINNIYKSNSNSARQTQDSTNSSSTSSSSSSTSPTIKEIKSRATNSNGNNVRNLVLANRRKAASMEKLNNSGPSNNDKISSNSPSDASNGSPLRNGPLNRTASRVSRFRTAKAVFERLSNSGNNSNSLSHDNNNSAKSKVGNSSNLNSQAKPQRPHAPDKPRGTIVSRYAAATLARASTASMTPVVTHVTTATTTTNTNTPSSTPPIVSHISVVSGVAGSANSIHVNSPRSRIGASSLQQSFTTNTKPTNIISSHTHHAAHHDSKKANSSHQSSQMPKPQPRVVTSTKQDMPNKTRNGPLSTYTSTAHQVSSSSISSTPTKSSNNNSNNTSPNLTPATVSINLDDNKLIIQQTLIDERTSEKIPSDVMTLNEPKTDAANSNKPLPKELIDKIVLEIASDAPDPNCTIQDLSNCDISGIPETLDFEKCFQDVEMMTEEEARKLLSKNSSTSDFIKVSSKMQSSSNDTSPGPTSHDEPVVVDNKIFKDSSTTNDQPVTSESKHDIELISEIVITPQVISSQETIQLDRSPSPSSSRPNPNTSTRNKVRFSDELVEVFSTHAVEDYDRRNDDIDPVAASAEYEIEKSREREEALELESCDEINSNCQDGSDTHVSETSEKKYSDQEQPKDYVDSDSNNLSLVDTKTKAYIESLEIEVGLKKILEQNLRDLQCQYYEAVRELDAYKDSQEAKVIEYKELINDLKNKLESSQNEISDRDEQTKSLRNEFNNIKESSQLLEKKYHRAKKIIKDMQSREQSYTRREHLYQQKLDEIEFELSKLIESINTTIKDETMNYISIIKSNNNNNINNNVDIASKSIITTSKAQFNIFAFINKILENFTNYQECQNPQIKQRVATILEQKLALLIAQNNNGSTQIMGELTSTSLTDHHEDNGNQNSNTLRFTSRLQSNTDTYLTNRASCPVGVNVTSLPPALTMPINYGVQTLTNNKNTASGQNGSSPPNSVNSYPSSSSLTSLNQANTNYNLNTYNSLTINNNNLILCNKSNNNNNNNNNNNQKDFTPSIVPIISAGSNNINLPNQNLVSAEIDKLNSSIPLADVPYETDEWHDKPVSEWTTTQVSTWLLALGLDQYISKFEDRNINGQSLVNLDSTLLKGFGVLNSNDRNLLKKKIRKLRADMEKERKLEEKKLQRDKTKSKFLI